MATGKVFCVFIVAVLASCANSYNCPPQENIPTCSCSSDSHWHARVTCIGRENDQQVDIETSLKMMQNSFSNETDLDLSFLSYIEPSDVTSLSFRGMPVRMLQFSKCHLESSAGPAFRGLENTLETIRIEKSMLAPERYGSFHQRFPFTVGHLGKLRTFELDDNRFYEIGNDLFGEGGRTVEEVILTKNEIREVGDRAFSNLVNLRTFDARHNKISILKREMFPNPATRLEELLFEENNVRELPSDMFVNMPSLTFVNFDANKIVYVDESTWKPVWSQLDFVYLGGNLYCGEGIEWMFSTRRPKSLGGICRLPGNRNMKRLESLIDEKVQRE